MLSLQKVTGKTTTCFKPVIQATIPRAPTTKHKMTSQHVCKQPSAKPWSLHISHAAFLHGLAAAPRFCFKARNSRTRPLPDTERHSQRSSLRLASLPLAACLSHLFTAESDLEFHERWLRDMLIMACLADVKK